MAILGEAWGSSGAPHVFVDTEGRSVALAIFRYGVTITDDGGTTQLGHVEETDDPEVIRFAGRLFRAIPG